MESFRAEFVELYEENGVCNFHVEMKVARSDFEVLTNGEKWRKSMSCPWCEVVAIMKTSGVELENVTVMSRME